MKERDDRTQPTIRMRRCGIDRTLNGYIFSDRDHAKQWLRQPFVDLKEIELEEVIVGAIVPCPRCNGNGHGQDVKLVRRMAIAEVLDV